MVSKLPKHIFSLYEKEKWLKRIYNIYEDMKLKSKNGKYEVKIRNYPFVVYPNVYAPQLFSDSLWFSEELPQIIKNKSLLEIGTGTGVIGIFCALKGAKVVLTDINHDAVKNAKENVKKYDLDISVREGNLYEPLEESEKFDYIFWAHPYNNSEEFVDDMLLRSGFDHNYAGLESYIKNAKKYLNNEGKLLLGTGDSADIETITQIADKEGYSIEILKESEMLLNKNGIDKIINMILQFN
jgi:release factor glutamine methyltransferase